jgi:hypothetical protein
MEGVVESVSKERLREIFHEEAVSYQAVKTWKESKDSEFGNKVRRLRELTIREHNPPIVVAVDEMGPISLQPPTATPGRGRGTPTACVRRTSELSGFGT